MFVVSCWKVTQHEYKVYRQLLIRGTKLTVTWPQPWWPLHAPKLLWKWLKQATQFPICHNHARPKWADICRSVLFEKRMLHLWLVALCVHVVMWPSIRPSSRPRCTCSVKRIQSGWCGSGFAGFWWGIPCLWVPLCVCLTPAVTKVKP